jgi:VWFA-related protein
MSRALKYAISFLLCVPVVAQVPKSDTPTIKAAARLVVLDIVVTDRNGKAVHGLKAADFQISEDSAMQSVRSFEEHTGTVTGPGNSIQMPPGMFTNFTTVPPDNVTNILLIDRLNTERMDQQNLQRQLSSFLGTAKPGMRMGIFVLGTRLSLLQGPTTDLAQLRLKLQSSTARNATLRPDTLHDSFADQMEAMGVSAAVVASLRQSEAQSNAAKLNVRVKLTLDAMNQLGRYLSGIPGRKNVVWLSGSFPLNVFPNSITAPLNPFDTAANYEAELRRTTGMLAQAQVAVYPVNAGGLKTSPVFDAENTKSYAQRNNASQASRMAQDNAQFEDSTTAENDTMNRMAESTGGRALHDTNGLADAVASALTDGADFYTLAYTPTNTKNDGAYRKIKVQLKSAAYTLRYRRGYFASASNAPQASAAMRNAVALGTPAPTEIFLKAAVFPAVAGNPEEASAAPQNLLAANVSGPFRRYTVDSLINPTDLTFAHGPDGKVHGAFDLAVLVYDAQGTLVNHLLSQLRVAATPYEFQQDMQQGVQYHQEISVPEKGEYFLRIVVHDDAADKVGALEVPISSVQNLAPLHTAAK